MGSDNGTAVIERVRSGGTATAETMRPVLERIGLMKKQRHYGKWSLITTVAIIPIAMGFYAAMRHKRDD